MRKIAQGIRGRADELTDTIVAEGGKTKDLARVEVMFTADYLDYQAEWARRYEGEIIQSDRPRENILSFKRPLGVIAGILPRNFPFFLIARKMGPDLVTGNTIVVKPSSVTPINCHIFAEIIDAVGLPAGMFNVVDGPGAEIGNALSAHPQVDMVSLTGSVEAGRQVMEAASANITKVSLELGGKRTEGRGYFFEPTLLTDTDNSMDIMKEETFGLVLPVSAFDTLDQVIALANDCEFGLTSSVYTTNLNEAFYVTRRLQFGETYINRENFEAMQGFHAGWEKSGIGGADGKHGLEEYLQTQVIYLETDI